MSSKPAGCVQILPVDIDRPTWETTRLGYIGGSEIAVLYGLGHKGAYTLWAEKTGRVRSEPPSPDATRGLLMEPVVVKLWQQCYPNQLSDVRRIGMVRSKRYKRAACNPDRTSRCPLGDCLLQIKTQRWIGEWGSTDFPAIPVPFEFQGQWELGVTGRHHVHFIVMGPGFVLFERIMGRDNQLIDKMFCAAAKWWGRHIIADTPPPATVSDFDAVRGIYRRSAAGKLHRLTDDQAARWQDMIEAERVAADAVKTAGNLRVGLQAEIGDAEEIRWPHGAVAGMWRTSATLDGVTAAWKQAHEDIAARYGVPKYWVDVDKRKLVADYGPNLPDGLRYRRTWTVKDLKEKQ